MNVTRPRERGSEVTLDLVDRVEAILRDERAPLSRAAVRRRLAAKESAVTNAQLDAVIAHLSKHLVVIDGRNHGVVWLGRPNLELLERLARAPVVR